MLIALLVFFFLIIPLLTFIYIYTNTPNARYEVEQTLIICCIPFANIIVFLFVLKENGFVNPFKQLKSILFKL
jgi:hypothetical protein